MSMLSKKIIAPCIAVMFGMCAAMTAYADAIGVCTHVGHGYSATANAEAAAGMKAGWVRDEFTWRLIEPSKGVRAIPAQQKDYLIRLKNNGINTLMILAYGNAAYASANEVMPTASNTDYYKAWLDYVRFVTSEMKDYVDVWEIWNEPDIHGGGTAAEYAQLYTDARDVIREIDSDAKVICGSLTAQQNWTFADSMLSALKTIAQSRGTTINGLVDAISLHSYAGDDPANYSNILAYGNSNLGLEKHLDDYGYTGEVWMTESGMSTYSGGKSEADQARYAVNMIIRFEKYLKENGRTGEFIWYDLRNDGADISNYEYNLGLTDYAYQPKTAYKTLHLYNRLVGDKSFVSATTYDSGSTYSDRTVRRSEFSGSTGKVYIWSKATQTIPLSGDCVRIYDYQGNITQTITNPSGSKSITAGENPVFVECVSYKATIDSAVYDPDNKTVSVSGIYNNGSSITLELIKNNTVQKSVTATVADGEYSKWFSVLEPGTYTVRAGYPEFTAAGKTSGWATKNITVTDEGTTVKIPFFANGTAISYDAAKRKVSISGRISDYTDEQYVTVLAIPATMDISNIDMSSVGYTKQIMAVNGAFSAEFTLPEYYTTRTAIYLGGTEIDSKQTGYADIEENKYLYVASFDISKGSTLSAAAMVRNFSETEKKAAIIIAQYDSSGRMVAVSSENKTIPARTYAATARSLTGVSIDKNAVKAVAYIWDGIGELTPLAEFDELELNK